MESRELAARLVAARRPGAAPLAPDDAAMPRDLAAAYRVQDAVVRLTAAGGQGRPWGWKVAVASPAAQRWHKVAEPARGRMFAGGLRQSPARLPAGRWRP